MVADTRCAGSAVNVNWNADNGQWNVNANRLDDDNWSDGNRVFSRNSPISPAPYGAGVFDCNPFLHPPTILPTSSITWPSSA